MAESKKIQSMIGLEENQAINLSASVEGLSNVVVVELLRGISHDSRKHAGFYKAILTLLKSEQKAINEQEYINLQSVIEKHIQIESRMIKEVNSLLKNEKDTRIVQILKQIYDDELRHHTLMEHLLEAVIRREAILEEDVWDMVWSDVPGHGAPPG